MRAGRGISAPEAMPIDLITVLKQTDVRDARGNRPVFALRWVTHDVRRSKNGSRHLHMKKVRRVGAQHDLVKHNQISVQPEDGGHPIPVHVRLITHYNGDTVI
jgi:hypothetical protein